MLDWYSALEALKKTGTMGSAGALLRISQSAVSKRIAALEHETGKQLIAEIRHDLFGKLCARHSVSSQQHGMGVEQGTEP